jgi:hypothetical protein
VSVVVPERAVAPDADSVVKAPLDAVEAPTVVPLIVPPVTVALLVDKDTPEIAPPVIFTELMAKWSVRLTTPAVPPPPSEYTRALSPVATVTVVPDPCERTTD